MKLIFKLIDWINKETWWRRYYKRVNLDEPTTWGGRCLVCHANTSKNKSIQCNITKGRACPCKYNQCLKLR